MKKKFIYILLPAVISFAACKKPLDQQPQASLDATIAFTTKQGVEAGIIGAYDGFQGTGYYNLNFLLFSEMYADNIQEVGTFPSFAQVYNKSITADNTDIALMWNAMYVPINRANNILASAPAITDPSFAKDRAIGECETIRAMAYFDLLRTFGGGPTGFNQSGGLGVPLRVTPTLTASNGYNVPRATEAAVLTQILADLTDAIAKLPVKSVGPGRVNKYIATALLARVQLYRAQYTEAEAQATTVINSGAYNLVSGANYGTNFSPNTVSSEIIWQIPYSASDANNIAFYYYPTSSGGRNEVSSTASLLAAIESGDVRKPFDYTTTPIGKQGKYVNVSPGIDPVNLFRLAEMYLIRAEARAMQNTPTSLAGALADLNVIRTRAGLAPSTAITQAALMAAIIQEDRIEFAHEAHRFFDLRRVNQTGLTQTARNLFPIPQSEILNSGGVVTQNPGGVY
ncbi:MAG: SusD family protein [Mucilaginibacter sp.]|nr:SusD family protein [Mucilaginibacter sp.]